VLAPLAGADRRTSANLKGRFDESHALALCLGAVGIAVLSLGVASHSQGFRGQTKELVALVESKIMGYEPMH
jgi:hypothetical protein